MELLKAAYIIKKFTPIVWKVFRMPCSSCMQEEEKVIGTVTLDVMYITKKNPTFGGRFFFWRLISSDHKTDEYGNVLIKVQSIFYTTVCFGEDSYHRVQKRK